jgi:hypothetical protein
MTVETIGKLHFVRLKHARLSLENITLLLVYSQGFGFLRMLRGKRTLLLTAGKSKIN